MKFTFIVFLISFIPILLAANQNYKLEDKKVYIEIESLANFGVIEEDVIYKVNDEIILEQKLFLKKQGRRTLVIYKFIANADENFKYFEVHPTMNTDLLNYEVTNQINNKSVMIESKVLLKPNQKNIGLMYTYKVFNVFQYSNFSQISRMDISDFNVGPDVSVEFNVFLSNFPLQLQKANLKINNNDFNLSLLEKYKMKHLIKRELINYNDEDKSNKDENQTLRKADIKNTLKRKKDGEENLSIENKNGNDLHGRIPTSSVYYIKFIKKYKKDTIEYLNIEIKGLPTRYFNERKKEAEDISAGKTNLKSIYTTKYNSSPYTGKNYSSGVHFLGGASYESSQSGNNSSYSSTSGFLHAIFAFTYISCLFLICFDCCGLCSSSQGSNMLGDDSTKNKEYYIANKFTNYENNNPGYK